MAIHRVIVGVDGSLGSLQALRYAEAEARHRDVPLVPVIAWTPPGGDLAERRHSSPYLRKIWREAAWERLRAAFDDGLGGMPAGGGALCRYGRREDAERENCEDCQRADDFLHGILL